MCINKGRNEVEVQSLSSFAKLVLDIGDGKVRSPSNAMLPILEDDICIPKYFCNLHGINSVDEMIESTFRDLIEIFQNPKYLSERSILSPTNQTVGHVNSSIVQKLPGEMFSYFSIDIAEDFPGTGRDQLQSFPPEYLNSINISGLALHELKLKVGVVVMLM